MWLGHLEVKVTGAGSASITLWRLSSVDPSASYGSYHPLTPFLKMKTLHDLNPILAVLEL